MSRATSTVAINSNTRRVLTRGVLVVGGEEVEGGETVDVNNVGVTVGSGVNLGDEHAGHLREGLGQLVVDGRQLLAVTAPRRVELHEHVLGLVKHDLFEALANEHVGTLALFSGDLLGLAESLGLAFQTVGHEGLDGLGVDFNGFVERNQFRIARGDLEGDQDGSRELLARGTPSLGQLVLTRSGQRNFGEQKQSTDPAVEVRLTRRR